MEPRAALAHHRRFLNARAGEKEDGVRHGADRSHDETDIGKRVTGLQIVELALRAIRCTTLQKVLLVALAGSRKTRSEAERRQRQSARHVDIRRHGPAFDWRGSFRFPRSGRFGFGELEAAGSPWLAPDQEHAPFLLPPGPLQTTQSRSQL